MSKAEIIVVHETVLASYLKDFGSAAAFAAVVGLGVLLDSQPLQWVGAIIWMIAMVSAAYRTFDNGRLTIDAARKRLDEIEGGAK
jgi:cell division protein FtsW (lipid II flippase)